MTYCYVLHCFEIQRIPHISWTRCRIVMRYGSTCRILYVQIDYIENSKLNIADKWLISLDHVTYGKNISDHVRRYIFNLHCNTQPTVFVISEMVGHWCVKIVLWTKERERSAGLVELAVDNDTLRRRTPCPQVKLKALCDLVTYRETTWTTDTQEWYTNYYY